MTKIVNCAQRTFFAATKAALESFTGSPIKQDAKIRQFVAKQFGLQNEHLIPGIFGDGESKPGRRTVYLCSLYCFDEVNGTLVYIKNRLASTEEELKAGMREFFASAFPDTDHPGKELLDFDVVISRMDELNDEAYDFGSDDDSADSDNAGQLESDFENFSTPEALEWLFENIDIQTLCNNLLPQYTQGCYQVKWEELCLD